MIIAHLPAGYLAACALDRAFDRDPLVWWAIVGGAVLPDLDMLWFYFVDARATHHHTYITHDPTLWGGVLLLGFVLASRLLIGLGIGAILHLGLDTIVGAVTWGPSFAQWSGPLVEVSARYDPWIWSFVLHWTFAIEVALVIAAGMRLWWVRR